MADSLKLVLVGDGSVGKTCLLSVYKGGKFPKEYVPTIVDNFSCDILVDNRSVRLHVWDTAGQEVYDRLRQLSYPGTAAFLLCLSVDSRSSYVNIPDKWLPEIKHYCPDVPIVLVATKTDLRTDPETIEHLRKQGTAPVSLTEGQVLARDIRANKYVECSALCNQGVDAVFQEAARVCFAPKDPDKPPKKRCDLL